MNVGRTDKRYVGGKKGEICLSKLSSICETQTTKTQPRSQEAIGKRQLKSMATREKKKRLKILLVSGTGYVGGRLEF